MKSIYELKKFHFLETGNYSDIHFLDKANNIFQTKNNEEGLAYCIKKYSKVSHIKIIATGPKTDKQAKQ